MSIPAKYIIEFDGKQKGANEYANAIKEAWRNKGGRAKDFKVINVYIKFEDRRVYFTTGNGVSGSLDMDGNDVVFDEE